MNRLIDNRWHRPRSLPVAPLVVRRKYLIAVPKLFPMAPLVVRRKYLVLVLRLLPRCTSQVLDRGAQANARGAAQVLDRGAEAAAHGATRCASQVLDRGAQVVASLSVASALSWCPGQYPRRRAGT
jgi:hypothetical protein